MFRPNTALTGVTSLLVESQQLEAIWINGSALQFPTPGGASGRTYDLTSVIPAGGTIENLSVKANAGQQFTWYGITINGQILTMASTTPTAPTDSTLTSPTLMTLGRIAAGTGTTSLPAVGL